MRLTSTEIARGRSQTYRLLSRLYAHGPVEELLDYLAAIPRLRMTLEEPFAGDDAAAAHQDIFGFNVFPHQSLFLDAAGLLGGEEAARVRLALGGVPYRADPENADDHVSEELAFLAFLSGAEADARRDGLERIADDMQGRQAAFMAEHLLRWLGPLAAAVQRQAQPFYTALVDLTLAFVDDHVAALANEPRLVAPEGPNFHPTSIDARAPATDLRAIGEYLLQTPNSGLYLSRRDLFRLGRVLELPRGFGDRRLILQNLLRTAADYDAFPALGHALAAEAADFIRRYGAMADEYAALAPWLTGWHSRAMATQALLTELTRLSASPPE